MLLATKPWTYWTAFPLLVSAALVLVSFAAVYLKKVVEPDIERRDALAAAAVGRSLSQSAPYRRLAQPAGERHGPPARVPRRTLANYS